jgi:RND family efflux transporter MFP subunit
MTTDAFHPAAAHGAALARPALGAARHKRRWKWIAWVLALGILAAVGQRVMHARAAAPTPVHVYRVQRGTVRDFVSSVAAGRVAGQKEAALRAEIAGTVRQLAKRRGDRVRAGEAILSYDTEELKERVGVADAAVKLARAQVSQADESAAVAATNAQRAKRLSDSGSLPTAEKDTLEGQWLVAQRAADAARAGLTQAIANLEVARTALSKAVVRAPFDATVLTTSVEEGEATVPGAPLVTIADVSQLHVDAEIDESDLGRLSLGMPADVMLDAFPGERIRGKLREIAPSVTHDARGGRSVAVEVLLPTDPRLRVGMSADVDVIATTHEDALFVPPNAVVGRGAERAVFVVDHGAARRRVIDAGVSTWEAVEVKGGLAEGDEVVAMGTSVQVADGTPIEPRR